MLGRYDIYVINLRHRVDKLKHIRDELGRYGCFNVIIVEGERTNPGTIGCARAHINLIKMAKNKRLKYVIVCEDDLIIKIDDNELRTMLELLINNLDKWNIFNGAPNSVRKLVNVTKSFDRNFVNIDSGYGTIFMIYNSNVYDELLTYNGKYTIDSFISNKFIQIAYITHQAFSHISTYSDIDQDYKDFIGKKLEDQYKHIVSRNTIHHDKP